SWCRRYGCLRGASSEHVQANGSHQRHSRMGQGDRFSNAIARAGGEADEADVGGLTGAPTKVGRAREAAAEWRHLSADAEKSKCSNRGRSSCEVKTLPT